MFCNVATLGLTNAPVTLTTPPNSGASWNGPYQSQSALLTLTGAITTNIPITIPRAGYYIFQNLCTSGSSGYLAGAQPGSFYVQLTTGNSGNLIGLPPGKKCHVFSDGVNMDFVNAPDTSTAYDLHGVTALPSWMEACSVLPYLIKDGTIYNNTAYPALASVLLNTFGGTLGLSFAVPDERARARIGLDTTGTARLTSNVSGIVGTTMGSAGGNQTPQQHNHSASGSSGPHSHGFPNAPAVGTGNSGEGVAAYGTGPDADALYGATATNNATVSVNVSVANAFSGESGNVQPSIVSFLPLIKTVFLIGALAAAAQMLSHLIAGVAVV